jgi:hypothetical protein
MTDLNRFSGFFRDGFLDWLADNEHIYDTFEAHALALIAKGRTHYSARTIVEVLVHESILRENGGEFKIGNDRAPDLARVFAIRNPRHALFWEYRRADWPLFLEALGVSTKEAA